jgi:hypothetical protein
MIFIAGFCITIIREQTSLAIRQPSESPNPREHSHPRSLVLLLSGMTVVHNRRIEEPWMLY